MLRPLIEFLCLIMHFFRSLFPKQLGDPPDDEVPKPLSVASESPCVDFSKLKDNVADALCDNYENRDFLPHDKVDELVTKPIVESAIFAASLEASKGLENTTDLVQFVLSKGKQLFLIFLMSRKDWSRGDLALALKSCKDGNLNDDSLPVGFSKEQPSTVYSLKTTEEGRLCLLFGEWDRDHKDLFDTWQRRIAVPVFDSEGAFRFQFFAGQVLPFLEISVLPTSGGAFGAVSRAVIHAEHVKNMVIPTYYWNAPKKGHTPIASHEVAIKKAIIQRQVEHYYDKEAGNLYRGRGFKSPHLNKSVCAYQHNQDLCLLFPWAHGGNFGDYWRERENDARDRSSVQWLFKQLVGIFEGVAELNENNIRHGDLKPENILWFKHEGNGGIFRIADIGLATFHEREANTKDRKGIPTQTPSGTSRYEPPEMEETRGKGEPRSRQYDMWSMGCIVLEFLLWLAYGHGAILAFRILTPHYFWWKNVQDETYHVDDYVIAVMEKLTTDFESDSAFMDLLKIVQEALLVIQISSEYKSVSGCREIAGKVHEQVEEIYSRSITDEQYLRPLIRRSFSASELSRPQPKRNEVHQKDGKLAVPGQSESSTATLKLPSPAKENPALPETPAGIRIGIRAPTADVNAQSQAFRIPGNLSHQEESSNLNYDWNSVPDNDFAADFFTLVGWNVARPESSKTDMRPCPSCASRSPEELFDRVYDLTDLQQQARNCNICSLLEESLHRKGIRAPKVVALQQDAAHVRLRNGPNLLSLYSEPDPTIPTANGAPLGLSVLLKRGSPEFFQLLKEWTRDCDSEHDMCRRNDASTVPTRLIKVDNGLRLVDAEEAKSSRYVALSHCWGPLKDDEKFCTYKRNIKQLQAYIDFDALPRTFRDAVTVSRGLGIDYIWIDSLCIIQDDDDDWQKESRKMEQVFSAAYCTIGASSAKSSLEGFLADPSPRSVVALPSSGRGPAYACIDIDDFHSDVELAPLNSRGWVLQERALSRRTIFFTSTQVYWECGAGIHCETLARLENSKIALLGDANFPNAAVGHYRDGRQLLIQDLYERYSGLAFTNSADRSVAVEGLQKRLARTLNTNAAFGVFEAYFARGLLWKRRDFKLMRPILRPRGHRVPSWSSLSKEGRIKYMDGTTELKFKEVEWTTREYENPFDVSNGSGSGIEKATFKGYARKMNLPIEDILRIVRFDCHEEYKANELRYVVLARNRTAEKQVDVRCHGLVIHEEQNASGESVYVRVGMGSLKSSAIDTEGVWVTIH
ncbi:HET-domain-containing protein [Pyrenochaeta sp. DS3sAY3a]|nr:HET-domain-containing protein [Pyrenochaeta sp. DS3sAY3a]